MKDKKIGTVIKTESKVIAYVVICLVIIVLGISYALFFEVKGNEKNQIVKAGTLEFTYEKGSQITNDTNSDCFISMNEEEAIKHSECEYKISITNIGTLPGNYNIKLNSETVDKPLALNKLKIILKKEGQMVDGYPKEGTTTSLVENEKIEAGSVINYTIQVYVDVDNELLNADDDEKNISLKINGDAVVNSEELNPTMPAADYIKLLAQSDSVNLSYDGKESLGEELGTDDNNLRYIGSSPNNYVDIGDRDGNGNPILWRIIGVMNKITNLDNGEHQESLVKIIRAESIGTYSWDSSASGINNGAGVNEWSEADVMKLLNPNTVYSGTPAIGGSLYWNRGSGSCYSGQNEVNTKCDFTSSGLSEEAKGKIVKVRWNTGTVGEGYDINKSTTAKYMYEAERSNHNGKEYCESTGGDYCNDSVTRTTTWDGYIGLIYPSDYGYAVGGSVRNTCLGKTMISYNSDYCNTNDWLKPNSGNLWTITSEPRSIYSNNVFNLSSNGYVYDYHADDARDTLPVVYLKPSVKILENPQPDKLYGGIDNPFVLQ